MNFGNLGNMSLPVQFATPLGVVPWLVLAGVPVGIIALYFLKLRRRPVQVPSTLLWRRSLEDLHVNSLFQRLRRNLLLFLQLLAVFLAMLALAGPRVEGTTGQGQRFVLAIDNSASMSATDVAPSRLDAGQGGGEEDRRGMEADDLAMVIAFSDRAKVVSNYTGDRRLLLQRIDAIAPTEAHHLAPRGAPGGRGPGQPLEADRRGGRRLGGRHAQAEDLHRRRVPRRRGVQPGQPRARGDRDRPAAARRSAPAGDDAKPAAEPKAEGPVRQRRHPRLADPAERRAARHLPGLRPGPQLPRRGGRDRGPALPARPRPVRAGAGTLDRRDRAEAPAPERPVVQVRPARHRHGRAGGPADRRRRPAARQPRLHRRRQSEEGAGPGRDAGQPLPGRHPEDADGRRAGRRDRRHARGREVAGGSSATSSRAATTW